MKTIRIVFAVVVALALLPNASLAILFNGREYVQLSGQWYEVYHGENFKLVGTEVWVNFIEGTTEQQIANLNASLGGMVLKINCLGTYLIKSTTKPLPDPLDFMESYLNSSIVLKGKNNTEWKYDWPNDPGAWDLESGYVQRYLFRPPNDLFDNTINPGPAWELTTGSPSVKVGILDSGILFQHSELRENLWQNLGEDADADEHTLEFVGGVWVLDPDDINDEDDDDNGFIDDLIGYNTYHLGGPADVGDFRRGTIETEHGTAVSSIVAARTNNESQFAGIAGGWGQTPGVALVFCKMGPGFGDDEAIEGLDYLINGAEVNIINMSWGGGPPNDDISILLEEARDAGILMTVATGNDGNDLVSYPAEHPAVMAVGASSDDERSASSNYGEELKLTAPSFFTVAEGGIQNKTIIFTASSKWNQITNWEIEADPEEDPTKCKFGGTSGAAPQVAGVAALLLSQSQNPQDGVLTVDDLFEILCLTASKDDEANVGYELLEDHPYGTWNEEMGYGELKAGEAVTYGRRQVIELTTGWNLISSRMEPYYIEANGMDDEHGIFLTCAEISNDIVILKNFVGQFWLPAEEFCNIPAWNYLEGYQVNMSQVRTLVVLGRSEDPDEPVPLNLGWNIAVYLPEFSMEADDAIANIEDEQTLLMAKNNWGEFYIPWYAVGGPFNNMRDWAEDNGYFVKVNAATDLIYPAQQLAPRRPDPDPSLIAENNQHFQVAARTDHFHPVLINSIEADNMDMAAGDEIGVFTQDGICVGAAVVTGEIPMGVAVWRDDTLTVAIDGFRDNDRFLFYYWSANADAEYEPDSLNIFGDLDAHSNDDLTITRLRFGKQAKVIPTAFAITGAYPNPFNSSVSLKFEVPEPGTLKLTIYDTQGRRVQNVSLAPHQAGVFTWIWSGQDRFGVAVPSGVLLCRADYQSNTGTQNSALLKLVVLR